jgi:hypothetical protein
MKTIELLFYSGVIMMAIVVFSLKVTARNDFLDIFLKTLGKLVPFFTASYAVIQIFRLSGVIP